MSDIILAENFQNAAPDTVETVYTAPNTATSRGVKVKAFTAANSVTNSVSFKAYIYDVSGAVVNPVIPLSIVVRDRSNYGPSIINQVIPAGGSLRIESSQANGLNFYVTGYAQESDSV